MKALVLARQGKPVAPNIARAEWPDPPPPPPGHARLRVLASALNHLDLWVGAGVPGLNLTYPRVPGCDLCAEVVGVGPDTDQSWLGRRVILNAAVPLPPREHPDDPTHATLAPDYELLGEHRSPGTHAEFMNAPVTNLADIGELDPVESAASGLTFLTAWSMMVSKAGLYPGQWVLITGIGGGVALAALSIALHHRCRVIVTSRHADKLDRARALGAHHAVLDDGSDFSKPVRALTNKRGVDLAVDSAGKATHLSCIKSLARGGAYVTPGCTSGPDATTDLARIFWNQLRIYGSTMGSNDEFRAVAALLRDRALRPVIDSVYAPEQGHDAYARLESAQQFGKIVIRWA